VLSFSIFPMISFPAASDSWNSLDNDFIIPYYLCICTKCWRQILSPRYKKPRHCVCRFKGKAFKPTGMPMSEVEQIVISRDRLEALRLCDKDDLTGTGGKRMEVSRNRSADSCCCAEESSQGSHRRARP
jgi:predicted DNA-binding protein (UPF0251 family)